MISLVSLGGVMLDKSNASAQFVQETKTRLRAIEVRNDKADIAKEKWAILVAQSAERANYLCVKDAACNDFLGRMETR